MLRDHLPPIDTYLADAMSLTERGFLERYGWPWLVVPEPGPDILSKIRRPETVIGQTETQTTELASNAPGRHGASLDALCLELRPDRGVGPVVVGRSGDCDVVLLDESVSRQHAELDIGPDGVVLEDLHGRNGTWVDGVRLAPGARAPVPNAAVIRLGAVSGRVYSPTGFMDWLKLGAPRSGAAPGKWPGR